MSILHLPSYNLWPLPREVSVSAEKLVAVLFNPPSGVCKAAGRRLSLENHSLPDSTPSHKRVASVSLVPEHLQQQRDGPPPRGTCLSGGTAAHWGVVAAVRQPPGGLPDAMGVDSRAVIRVVTVSSQSGRPAVDSCTCWNGRR